MHFIAAPTGIYDAGNFSPSNDPIALTSTDATNKTFANDPINYTVNVSNIRRIFNRVSLGTTWPWRMDLFNVSM